MYAIQYRNFATAGAACFHTREKTKTFSSDLVQSIYLLKRRDTQPQCARGPQPVADQAELEDLEWVQKVPKNSRTSNSVLGINYKRLIIGKKITAQSQRNFAKGKHFRKNNLKI